VLSWLKSLFKEEPVPKQNVGKADARVILDDAGVLTFKLKGYVFGNPHDNFYGAMSVEDVFETFVGRIYEDRHVIHSRVSYPASKIVRIELVNVEEHWV
jgi:hypothetical protein